MAALLEKYRKVAGTGPGSTIGLADWNGLIDELSTTLAGLVKKGADFDAVATVAIGVLLDRINNVLGPAYDQVSARGAQIEALYAQISGTGISAESVIESATRLFLTDARRAAILAELRGGVPSDGDTLMELYTAIQASQAAIRAIPSDTLRYGAPQSISTGQISRLRQNARLPGSGFAYDLTDGYQLTADHVGICLFYDVSRTVYLPKFVDCSIGDEVEFFIRANVGVQVTVRTNPADTIQSVGSVVADPAFQVLTGGNYIAKRHDGSWRVTGTPANETNALLADRAQTFSDAQIKQLLINASINSGFAQCRLEYVSPTECRVKGVGGNKVLVDGVVRTIPKDGVPISNAGLTANTSWYLYLAWDGSKLICFGQPYVPAIDPISGMVCSSAYTYHLYMGKVYIDASGQFKDSPGTRFVLTHYNKRWRGIRGPVGTYSTSSSSASVELSTGARAFLCLDGANGASTILIGLAGTGGAGATSPGYGIYTAASLNGVDYTPTALAGNAAYGNSDAGGMDTVEAGDGLHYVTIKGQTNGNYTASVTGCVVGMVLM